MNANFDLTYLEGGDDWFGPNLGGATVYTNTSAGFVGGLPERGHIPPEPRLHARDGERDHGRDPRRRQDPAEAATAWLKENPACSTPGSRASPRRTGPRGCRP
jgi:glycine betaine/proline transport system substrate-binding protein